MPQCSEHSQSQTLNTYFYVAEVSPTKQDTFCHSDLSTNSWVETPGRTVTPILLMMMAALMNVLLPLLRPWQTPQRPIRDPPWQTL